MYRYPSTPPPDIIPNEMARLLRHAAAQCDLIELQQLSITAKSEDMMSIDEKGKTLLHLAVTSDANSANKKATVDFLLKDLQMLKKINQFDNNRFTILHYAVSLNDRDLVELIKDYLNKYSIAPALGHISPLHLALKGKEVTIDKSELWQREDISGNRFVWQVIEDDIINGKDPSGSSGFWQRPIPHKKICDKEFIRSRYINDYKLDFPQKDAANNSNDYEKSIRIYKEPQGLIESATTVEKYRLIDATIVSLLLGDPAQKTFFLKSKDEYGMTPIDIVINGCMNYMFKMMIEGHKTSELEKIKNEIDYRLNVLTNQYDTAICSLSKYSTEIQQFLTENMESFDYTQLLKENKNKDLLIETFITGRSQNTDIKIEIKKPLIHNSLKSQIDSASIFHLKIHKIAIPRNTYPYEITINEREYKINLAHVSGSSASSSGSSASSSGSSASGSSASSSGSSASSSQSYLHAIDIEPCIKIEQIPDNATIEFRTYAFRNKILTMEAKSLNGYIFPYVDSKQNDNFKNIILKLFYEELYNMTELHQNDQLNIDDSVEIEIGLDNLFDFYMRAYFYQIPNLIEKKYESDYIQIITEQLLKTIDNELLKQVKTMAVFEQMKDIVKAMRRAMFLTYEFAVKKIRFLDLKKKGS